MVHCCDGKYCGGTYQLTYGSPFSLQNSVEEVVLSSCPSPHSALFCDLIVVLWLTNSYRAAKKEIYMHL